MKSICVYLGAHSGSHPDFMATVLELGHVIVQQELTLIYGGSSLGLMGKLAETVKCQGGKVIGIITRHLLDKESPPDYLDELQVVESMQARKQRMQQQSDMFLAMPGGLGTLEEAFETWNAIKIGLLNKPMGFLNLNGYFDELFAFIKTCTQQGFIAETHSAIPVVSADVKNLLGQLTQ